jgi:membrane protein DedA with SNARE-associated domain
MLYACLIGSMFYWMMAGVIVLRRAVPPTPSDVFLISHGFLSLASVATIVLILWLESGY